MFDENRLSKSPSMFDKQKLTWMNNQYIKQLSLEKVVELSITTFTKSRNFYQKN